MQNKKEHRAQMLQMITQWQQSGLKQRAFCATNKIAYHVFHYWYGVYRSNQNATGSFLPVTITPTRNHEQITITGLSGMQIQLMLHLNSSTVYYWYNCPADTRKGFDALCGVVHLRSLAVENNETKLIEMSQSISQPPVGIFYSCTASKSFSFIQDLILNNRCSIQ